MLFDAASDRHAKAKVLDLVARERRYALSRREWKHRLTGFGYAIRETSDGDFVETLLGSQRICRLPAELSV